MCEHLHAKYDPIHTFNKIMLQKMLIQSTDSWIIFTLSHIVREMGDLASNSVTSLYLNFLISKIMTFTLTLSWTVLRSADEKYFMLMG